MFRRLRKQARDPKIHVGDPRFEAWETMREFEDLETALAWRQLLDDAGVESAVTSDWPLDRFGRGEIFLQVPPGSWSDAEEVLSGLDDA